MTLSDGVPPANRLTDWNKICSDECAHTGERNLLVISVGYYRGNCRGCQSREAEPMHFWLELQHAQYQDLETCGDVCRRQSLYSKLSEPFLVDPFQDVAVLLATLRLEYRRIIPLREVLSVLQMQPWCGGRSGCGELATQSARVNCCFLLGDGLNSISRNNGLTLCASKKASESSVHIHAHINRDADAGRDSGCKKPSGFSYDFCVESELGNCSVHTIHKYVIR